MKSQTETLPPKEWCKHPCKQAITKPEREHVIRQSVLPQSMCLSHEYFKMDIRSGHSVAYLHFDRTELLLGPITVIQLHFSETL